MTANRRRRAAIGAAIALGLALAALLHYRAHYAATERPGTPGPEAEELLADEAWGAVLWIPYPHQNLGALERRIGDLRELARELAEAGDPAATTSKMIPRFGPFVTPPARELAIALGEDGAVRAIARVYPTIAALARAAGTVARNPWLAGGEIRDRDGTSRGTVTWSGTLWTFASSSSLSRSVGSPGAGPAASDPVETGPGGRKRAMKRKGGRRAAGAGGAGGDSSARAAGSSGSEPAAGALAGDDTLPSSVEFLGVLSLRRSLAPLPAALYRAMRSESSGRLEILADSPPVESLLPASLVPPAAGAPAGWILDRSAAVQAAGARAVAGAEVAPDALRALAIWTDPGPVEGLPRIAALDRGGAKRYSLPGETLVKLVGEEVRERTVAGIRVRALDTAAVERGEGFARSLAASRPASLAAAETLAAAAPGSLEPVARGIAEKLGLLAGLAERERRGFARTAAVLGLFRGCSSSTLEVGAGESFVRLVPCNQTVLEGGRSR